MRPGASRLGGGAHRELAATPDPDAMLDVRLVGIRPDTLVLDPAKVSAALAGAFLRVRVRDRRRPRR